MLSGQSCGVFLILDAISRLPSAIRQKVAGVIAIAGIYDLHSLLEEYPTYISFLALAFGTDQTTWPTLPPHPADLPLLIVHSTEDELLSLKQPRDYHATRWQADPALTEFALVKGTHDGALDEPEMVQVIAGWLRKLASRTS